LRISRAIVGAGNLWDACCTSRFVVTGECRLQHAGGVEEFKPADDVVEDCARAFGIELTPQRCISSFERVAASALPCAHFTGVLLERREVGQEPIVPLRT
jgi:hypothetical protein